jgi:selenocysteine lyase/cysteine desulfurase
MSFSRKLSAFCREFPQLRGRIYFNHGAAAVVPVSVTRASIAGTKLEADFTISSATKRKWRKLREETRRMAAELIGAKPENLALVTSTSVALSLISLAIRWKSGDNVVTCGVENPATVVPWQNLKEQGVEVRYLPADESDLIDLDALPRMVNRRTRLVALSLVEYSTGQRLDIERVVDWCRPRGILVSVDGVQAVGAIPVDVKKLGVNFLSFGCQKWLLGPRNVAALYVDDDAVAAVRSPIVTEANVRDIRVEEELPTSGIPELRINEGALKFEAAPNNNFASICGFHQALTNFSAMGSGEIYRQVRAITDELVAGLADIPGQVVSPRGEKDYSGIVSFAPSGDAERIVAGLLKKNIHVALRKGRVRISPHFYNTSREVQTFRSELRELS